MGQALLLHDLLSQQNDLPVEEQNPGHLVPAYQPKLLFQPGLDLRSHGPVSTLRRLGTEALEVAVGGVACGDCGFGKGVAQVRGQVELTLLGDLQAVG